MTRELFIEKLSNPNITLKEKRKLALQAKKQFKIKTAYDNLLHKDFVICDICNNNCNISEHIENSSTMYILEKEAIKKGYCSSRQEFIQMWENSGKQDDATGRRIIPITSFKIKKCPEECKLAKLIQTYLKPIDYSFASWLRSL